MTDMLTPGAGLPVATGRRSWAEVWRLTRGHRLRLAGVVVLGVASAAAGLVMPAVIGQLIDRVDEGTADMAALLWAVGIMIGAAVLGAVGAALTVVIAARTYHAILAQLREQLVERALTLPQTTIEQAGTGDLVSRTSDDVAQIADAAPQIIPAFTMAGFTIAVTLAGMTVLDPWYGLALVVVLPVYVVTLRWYLRTAPGIYAAERTAMSGRAQQLLESQRGYDTIVGLGLGRHRHRRVLEASWAVVRYTLRTRTVQNMFFGRLNLAEYAGMAAILLTGFWLIDAGLSTVGAATTAMLLFLRLFGPINQLLFVIDVLQSAAASLNRMIGVITAGTSASSAKPELNGRPPATQEVGPASTPAVELDSVRFSYDVHHRVLDGIDLRIEPGKRVAVVGASGAGKTTLAAVLAGIHPPDAGTVTCPERTAVISQEVHVFTGTLRENLTLAAPDAEDQEIHSALKTTGAAGLLELLPAGLDTVVGTSKGAGGQELTAAQAQQIALTRLVLADPELAILDEATAEAGSAHAGLLDAAADAALTGRTGLVIAHRLSQAAACDRIIVMAAGRIIEEGPHQELLETEGAYAQLWKAWQTGRSTENT